MAIMACREHWVKLVLIPKISNQRNYGNKWLMDLVFQGDQLMSKSIIKQMANAEIVEITLKQWSLSWMTSWHMVLLRWYKSEKLWEIQSQQAFEIKNYRLQFQIHHVPVIAVTYKSMTIEPEASVVPMAALIPTTGPWLPQPMDSLLRE